jgi:hypothetical protein
MRISSYFGMNFKRQRGKIRWLKCEQSRVSEMFWAFVVKLLDGVRPVKIRRAARGAEEAHEAGRT